MKKTIGVILIVIFVTAVLWEINWFLEMQKLVWELKVSEVAQFRCRLSNEKIMWSSDALFLKWKCKEYYER